MNVSIIIPTYNGVELLKQNLPSILAARENVKNYIKEIIVVDDLSSDESVTYLRWNFADVKIIKHKKNRGFSAAVNTGVRAAKSELILLLNNDVKVESDFLESVVPHFSNSNTFAVSLH